MSATVSLATVVWQLHVIECGHSTICVTEAVARERNCGSVGGPAYRQAEHGIILRPADMGVGRLTDAKGLPASFVKGKRIRGVPVRAAHVPNNGRLANHG